MHELFKQLTVNPQQGITLAHQIKQQVTWLISSGRLKAGDWLPSVRQMAQHLSTNLHTVRSAYQIMEAEGLVETHQGRGTQVLGYDPLRMAQAVGAIRTHTIGVIVPSLMNPFYHAFLQGIGEVADQDRSLLFVCNTQDDPGEAWRYYAQLATKQVDGIIIASSGIDSFLRSASVPPGSAATLIPYVTVDWPEAAGYSVLLDLEGAGFQATQHLLQHGHRRIGLITYAFDIPNVSPVNAGYQRALRAAGIDLDSDLVAKVQGFGISSGNDGARKLLSLPKPPTAIFAITDLLAIGAMQVIRQAGLLIPQDIALVGFNDIPMAELLDPPLTTVSAPSRQLGQEAMRMLQKLISSCPPVHKQVTLSTTLIVRQSCGCSLPAG